MADAPVNTAIVERYYQTRAVRRICAAFQVGERKALVVMATGAGKARTVIALCELVVRRNWANAEHPTAHRRAEHCARRLQSRHPSPRTVRRAAVLGAPRSCARS